jgi:hypothetical protein
MFSYIGFDPGGDKPAYGEPRAYTLPHLARRPLAKLGRKIEV